jgi:phosphoserine phosphatase
MSGAINSAQSEPFPESPTQELTSHLSRLRSAPHKIAALDMDNTLLMGDIGDAVLAQLVSAGTLDAAAWILYLELLAASPTLGHKHAVTCMAGLTISTVDQATRSILQTSLGEITPVAGMEPVLMPHVFSTMRDVVRSLRKHEYEIFMVSATNVWSTRIVAEDYFDIEADHVIGIEAVVSGDGSLTSILKEPVPSGTGKVTAMEQRFSGRRPLVVASDSPSDYPMLAYSDPDGVVIWVGSQQKFAAARAALPTIKNWVMIPPTVP